MIKVKNIHKYYDDLHVLKGVDFSIKQGEIVSIVGASGAGKSTLLHILGTLDNADQGELFIKGDSITKLSNNQLARFRNLNVGFVFQFHNLLPEFSAMENICIPGYISSEYLYTPARVRADYFKEFYPY